MASVSEMSRDEIEAYAEQLAKAGRESLYWAALVIVELEDNADTKDGADGQPEPNIFMRLHADLEHALGYLRAALAKNPNPIPDELCNGEGPQATVSESPEAGIGAGCVDVSLTGRFEKLVRNIAALETWQPGDGRVPTDGMQDSHDTLMRVIEEAQFVLAAAPELQPAQGSLSSLQTGDQPAQEPAPEPPRGESCDHQFIQRDGILNTRICRKCGERRRRDAEGRWGIESTPQMGRDWTEDFAHENGSYECSCVNCGNSFRGHKRRHVCKACATKATPETGHSR